MSVHRQIPSDDAPIATSKHRKGKRELVAQSVTINQKPKVVFDLFRDFSRLPEFMENVERVDLIDARRSHWVVKGPGNSTVEWDAAIIEEIDGESLTWQSEEGADVANSGRVTFRDAGERGTVVTATIAYSPPAGMIGKLIAKIFQREPSVQTRRDLRRLKQYLETGEIATAARNRALHTDKETP